MTSSSSSTVSFHAPEGADIQVSSVNPDDRASRNRINEANATSIRTREEIQHKFVLAISSVITAVCACGVFFAEPSMRPQCLDMLKIILAAVVAYKAGEQKGKG